MFFDRNREDCARNRVENWYKEENFPEENVYRRRRKLKGCEESLYDLGDAVVLLSQAELTTRFLIR
jgi:hypothetical protein